MQFCAELHQIFITANFCLQLHAHISTAMQCCLHCLTIFYFYQTMTSSDVIRLKYFKVINFVALVNYLTAKID